VRQATGTLLRRLLTALALAASLAFGLGPAAALGSASRPGDDGLTDARPPGPGHHPAAHQAACCGTLCVPALAADDAPVPPPDRMPSGLAHPHDTSKTGIEIGAPSPPPRP
jgi:hypothetical protein